MPKLKPATLEARREEILAAAERCFAREGFHQTTIQDVIRESGLSAGGIYGHFRSKDELIAAIAEARHARDARLLGAASGAAGDPLAAVSAMAQGFMADLDTPDGELARRVGLQVWAEALRNPEIRDQVVAGLAPPIAAIADTLRRGAGAGAIRADVEPEATARTLVALFHGFVLQRLWGVDFDRAATLKAFEALLDGLKARD